MKSSSTCDGSSPEPLAELPAPLRHRGVFPWGSDQPREGHGGKGDKVFRRDGEVPRALGLSPPLCHCSLSAAFEQEQGKAPCLGAHPCSPWAPCCSTWCWVLTSPSGPCLTSPETPSPPPNTASTHHPALVCRMFTTASSGLCWFPELGDLQADPILIKPEPESCCLLSLSPSMFTEKGGNSPSLQNSVPSPPPPPGVSWEWHPFSI